MKYLDIEDAMIALKAVSNKVLPRRLSVAIVRNTEKLSAISDTITKQRTEIAKQYAIIENGEFKFYNHPDGRQTFTFDSQEKMDACSKEMEELLAMEEDVQIIKVSASELDKCEENPRFDMLTAQEEISLAFMLDYEE